MNFNELENIDDRISVLRVSLKIENAISEYLAQLVNVTDVAGSNSFSNKSSALSFNQKVNLLIDINALEKESKQVLITFMEIRNQFMHNINAYNNVECIKFLDGKDKFLLKRYPQETNISFDLQITNAITKLCEEALNITISIVNVINDKVIDQALNNVTSQLAIALMQSNLIIRDEFDKHIDKLKDHVFSGEEVKKLYLEYSSKIFKTAQEKVSLENKKKATENGK